MEYIDRPNTGIQGIVNPESAVMTGRIITDSMDALARFNQAFPLTTLKVVNFAQRMRGAAMDENGQPFKDKAEVIFKAFLPDFYRPERAPDWDATLHFDITDAGRYTVRVDGNACTTEAGHTGTPTAAIGMDMQTLAGVLKYGILDQANKLEAAGFVEPEPSESELNDEMLDAVVGGRRTCAAEGGEAACMLLACESEAAGGETQSPIGGDAGEGYDSGGKCGAALCGTDMALGDQCAMDYCSTQMGGGQSSGISNCLSDASVGGACGVDVACAAAQCGQEYAVVDGCFQDTTIDGICGVDVGIQGQCVSDYCGVAVCGSDTGGGPDSHVTCIAEAGGKDVCGAELCAADVGGVTTCEAESCGLDVGGMAQCAADVCLIEIGGVTACDSDLCAADLGVADSCGEAACYMEMTAAGSACDAEQCMVDVTVASQCGTDTCTVDLTLFDVCGTDSCAMDLIPFIQGI